MKKIIIMVFGLGSGLIFASDYELKDGEYFLPDGLLDYFEMSPQEKEARKDAKRYRREQEKLRREEERLREGEEFRFMSREDVLSARMMHDYRAQQKRAEQKVAVAEGEKRSFDDVSGDEDQVALSSEEKKRLKKQEENRKKREKEKRKRTAARAKEVENEQAMREYEQDKEDAFHALVIRSFEIFFDGSMTAKSNSAQLMLDYLQSDDSMYHDRSDAIATYKGIVKKYDDLHQKRKVDSVRAKTIVRQRMADVYGVVDKTQQDTVCDAIGVLHLMQLDCDSRGKKHGDIVLDLYFWNVFFQRALLVMQASMQDPTGLLQQDLTAFFEPDAFCLVENFQGVLPLYRANPVIMELLKFRLANLYKAQQNVVNSGILPDVFVPQAEQLQNYIQQMLASIR